MTDIEKVCKECLINIVDKRDEMNESLLETKSVSSQRETIKEYTEDVENIIEFCKENHKTQ